MMAWTLMAVGGGVLSLVGFAVMVRRYRRREVAARVLLATTVGFLSFVSYALVTALRPEFSSGPVTIAVLAPAFVAIVVLVRHHQGKHGSA